MKLKIIFSVYLTLLIHENIKSQWNSDPKQTTPVCTDTLDQRSPQMISDGNGGAIITWWDDRTTVYAQRIDTNGIPLWNIDGIPICTVQAGMGVGTGASPQKIIGDGAGGAIIVWTDGRYGNSDIFAQHVDQNGKILWDSLGVPICTLNGYQYDVKLISDGVGGAIMVWRDDRSDVTDSDIYAQRIAGDGSIYWMEDGVPVSVANEKQLSPEITEDGVGGAIITWTDYRDYATKGEDIYVQRIDSSGEVQWTNNGALVCNADGNQEYSVICKSPDGGAIIAWTDQRYSQYSGVDIFAQRINSSGTAQWTIDGIAMCTSSGAQNSLDIVSDHSGGAFIVWEDSRVSPTYDDRDIYAQFVDASGTKYWGFYGIPVCIADDYQFKPRVISDGEGGMYVVWEDRRPLDNENNDKVFMQRMNSQGLPVWQENGIAVCKANWAYPSPQLINDGLNDVIVVWEDRRTKDNYDIYIQHIDKNTFPGKPLPEIISVADVPDDNGGKVRMIWSASAVDVAGLSPQITNYGIWRKMNASSDHKKGINYFNNLLNDSLETDYEYIANVPAVQSETYNAVVNTLHDMEDETFLITAHAENPNYYIVSSAMTGQSMNNSTVDVPIDLSNTSSALKLYQNYPNPFNHTTHITFDLSEEAEVKLGVYSMQGEELSILIHETLYPGSYMVEWNGENYSSGIYLYRIEVNGFIQVKKLQLVK